MNEEVEKKLSAQTLAETRKIVGEYCKDIEGELLATLERGCVIRPGDARECAWYTRCLRIATEQPEKTEVVGKLFCALVDRRADPALAHTVLSAIGTIDMAAIRVLLALDNPLASANHAQPVNRLKMLADTLREPEANLESLAFQLQCAGLVEDVGIAEPPCRADGYDISFVERRQILVSPCTTPAGELVAAAIGGDEQQKNRPERFGVGNLTPVPSWNSRGERLPSSVPVAVH